LLLCARRAGDIDRLLHGPLGELTALPRPPGWILGRGKEWEKGMGRKGRGGKKGKKKRQ